VHSDLKAPRFIKGFTKLLAVCLHKRYFIYFFCQKLILISICIFCTRSYAQPSAGSLLQQLESEKPQLILPTAQPKLSPSVPSIQQPSSSSFVIKRFVFKGNQKANETELNEFLKNYLNRPVTFNDIKAAADLTADYYRDRGWLVNTKIPPQDITDGNLTIDVTEAKFGGLDIVNESKRVSDQRIDSWVYSHLDVNEILSLDNLERMILLLNDLPDMSVEASLQQGKKIGDVAVRASVKDKPMLTGQFSVDNMGDYSTGVLRSSASLNATGLLGIGEQLTVLGMYSDGTTYGRLGLSAPVGTDGLRLGVNSSIMGYRVISPAFADLHSNGEAKTAGIEVSYPLIRTRPTNLYILSNYNYSDFNNTNIFSTASQYNTSVVQLGFSGNHFDWLWGGATTSASVIGSAGSVNLNNSPTFSSDASGPKTAGDFSKIRFAFNRLQSFTPTISGYASISGQVSNKNLDVSEQMYMGGPYGVRAYSLGQGASTQGNLATFELRHSLMPELHLSLFYDIANIQTWKSPDFASALDANNYVLQGGGLSIVWNGPVGMQIKATWAHRTGSLPDAVDQLLSQSAAGLAANRFWLSAALPI